MAQAHQHDEIEINLLARGSLTYLRAGELRTLRAGQAAVFWGASPHRLLRCSDDCQMTWLTLPTPAFLRFDLPAWLSSAVWSGELLLAEVQPGWEGQFGGWASDPQNREHALIQELELHAWLRRFALYARPFLAQVTPTQTPGRAPEPSAGTATAGAGQAHALALARRLQQDHARPLRIAELAAGLGLHPHYLSGVFRQTFGVAPQEYLARCRLAQAQALLIATDLSVTEVALESGFSSSSRFFAAFARRHGCSPRAFRQAHRTSGD